MPSSSSVYAPAHDAGVWDPVTTEIVLRPGKSTTYWTDLWRYRELLFFLAWRDTLVRYKQTAIGIGWAVLRPAAAMAVFVAFRRVAGFAGDHVPEVVFVFAAIIPWQFFSTALTEAANSLVAYSNLISKIYFPRLLVPVAAVATTIVDMLITLVLLALLMAWYRVVPGWQIMALPVFVVLVVGFSIGTGILLSALTAKYRDFRYVVPFVVQCGLFLSPIAFSLSSVPERWRTLYSLNPLVGIIEGFRWSILAGRTPPFEHAVVVSGSVTLLSIAVAIWYFRRVERSLADVI
jgi:lipopolysaccharide transport system permease protein